MRRIRFAWTIVALILPAALPGQVPQAATEMLRRIFASRDFAPERFGPAR